VASLQRGAAHPHPPHEGAVRDHVAPHARGHVARRHRLAVAVHLRERAEVVEVAAQRAQRRVVVGVQDRRLRHVGLGPAVGEHVARELLILGVGQRAERRALPCPARDGPVRAAEVRRRPQLGRPPVHPRPAEAAEVLEQLAAHHRARIRPREVWAGDQRDVVREREAAQERGEPARSGGLRVLGEEGDVLAAAQLHQPVARAAVRELRARDLQHACAVRAGHLAGAVGGPRVDHDELHLAVELLGAHRGEHAVEQRAAVQDRKGDGDGHAAARPFIACV
jgi:hypothetical protein